MTTTKKKPAKNTKVPNKPKTTKAPALAHATPPAPPEVSTELATTDDQISKIIATRITHTPMGLICSEQTTFEEWFTAYPFYTGVRERSKWWLGDYLRAGERFGERYAQAVHITDKSYSRLTTIVSVCGKFADLARRREEAPFTWHEIVAYLPPQTADKILDDAIKKHWTQSDVEDAAAKAAGRKTKSERKSEKESKSPGVKVTDNPDSPRPTAPPDAPTTRAEEPQPEPATTLNTPQPVVDGKFEIVTEIQGGKVTHQLPVSHPQSPESLLAAFVASIPSIDVEKLDIPELKEWLVRLLEVDKFIDRIQGAML